MLTSVHRVEARVETLGVAFMGKVLDLDRGGFLLRSGGLGKKHNHYLHLDFLPVKSVVIRMKRDYLGRIGQGRVVNTSGYAGCTLCCGAYQGVWLCAGKTLFPKTARRLDL